MGLPLLGWHLLQRSIFRDTIILPTSRCRYFEECLFQSGPTGTVMLPTSRCHNLRSESGKYQFLKLVLFQSSQSLKYSCAPAMLTVAGTLARLVLPFYLPLYPPNISLFLHCCSSSQMSPFLCCLSRRERKAGCHHFFICRPL